MQRSEEKIKMVIEMLNNLSKDQALPRNIKDICKEVVEKLSDKRITSYAVKAASSISRLEEAVQDQALPIYARTTIWKVISILEQVKD